MEPRRSSLPLVDLLDELRSRGLPLGVREYLSVGRLVQHWEETREGSLKAAVAALLARNRDEGALIRKVFEELYELGKEAGPATTPLEAAQAPPAAGVPPVSLRRTPLRERLERTGRGFLRHLRARWLAWTAGTLVVVALVLLAMPKPAPLPVTWPKPYKPIQGETPKPLPPPPPPTVYRKVYEIERLLDTTAGVSLALFLWLYLVRTHRQTRLRARRAWRESVDALPGPARYDLPERALQPPFSVGDLDEVATILTQRFGPTGRLELDVERTVDRTVRAGLATQIVRRPRRASVPILVLEDTGDEMRPWRRRTSSLLSALEARGVRLDRWRFRVDADRVFRSIGEPEISLRELALLHPESPLLVLSTGQGILEGEERRPSVWLEDLGRWRRRVWLHPGSDPGLWRPALSRVPVPVRPMSRTGLRDAARRLVLDNPPEPAEATFSAGRPVASLDIDRLRYLLSFSPRRDPDFAELLRQRFCPWVPEDAVAEALAHPPLTYQLAVGPLAEEVHELLAEELGNSRAPQRSAAGYRLRLDHVMQEIRLPERQPAALRELAVLAESPLAAEVESAIDRLLSRESEPGSPLSPGTLRQLAKILQSIRRRASREGLVVRADARRWTWPKWGELTAAVLCALTLLGLSPLMGSAFKSKVPVKVREMYDLSVQEDKGGAYLLLLQKKGAAAPKLGEIYQYDRELKPFNLPAYGSVRIPLSDRDRGNYYYARAALPSGDLAVSSPPVWVEPRVLPPRRTGWIVATFRNEKKELLDVRYALTAGGAVINGSTGEPVEVAEGDWMLQASKAGYVGAVEKVQVRGGGRDQPKEVSITLRRVPPEDSILTVRFFRSEAELTNVEYTALAPIGSVQGRSGKPLKLPGTISEWTISAETIGISKKIQVRQGQESSVRIDVPSSPLPPTPGITPTPPPSSLRIRSVEPKEIQKGKATLTLQGEGLDKVEEVSFSPPDIAAGPLRGGSSTDLKVEIDASKAAPGPHIIEAKGPNGSDILQKAFTVVEPARPLPPFKDALRAVLSKFQGREDFHFGERIKPSTLSNAVYQTKFPTSDKVIALVDVTVLHTGGRAFLFGERGVHYSSTEGLYHFTYSELTEQEITMTKRRLTGDEIAIGNKEFAMAGSGLPGKEMLEIVKAVQDLARKYQLAGVLK